ncbi:hypothetical protein ABT040_29115 [Streptomyces sp. NPDC002688]|uniref:hypothetical protein n=1 Tax=Streptomyces sp. NPDC002688 TaxID=3154423 RepID=UPI003316C7AB
MATRSGRQRPPVDESTHRCGGVIGDDGQLPVAVREDLQQQGNSVLRVGLFSGFHPCRGQQLLQMADLRLCRLAQQRPEHANRIGGPVIRHPQIEGAGSIQQLIGNGLQVIREEVAQHRS